MNALDTAMHVMAAIVLAGICCRLFDLQQGRPGWASQVTWHAWVTAHVLIGAGMVARLFGMEEHAALLVTAGLALYFGVRWSRRAGDR